MKNIIVSIICAFLSILSSKAISITGYVFLENSTNHAGIKAVFKAISPTASTDSTFTDSNGEYTIVLSSGIYELVISKESYSGLQYSQQLYSADDTLYHGTLKYVGSIVYLDGDISDTLYSDTTYVVMNKVWVNSVDHLYIEPGTEVSFADNAIFDVFGSITAIGNAEERITFKRLDNNLDKWDGLNISNKYKNVHFKYCNIVNATKGIEIFGVDTLIVEHCLFYSSTWGGIEIWANCAKRAFIHDNIFDQSHSFSYKGSATFECDFWNNTVRNMGGGGLDLDTGMTVWNNEFYRCKNGATGTAKLIRNNEFYDNMTGMQYIPRVGYIARNNTFFDNGRGMYIYGNYNGGEVINNCFSQNGVAILFNTINNTARVSYNFFEENAFIDGKIGYGIPIDTNSKGNKIDTYLNIVGDSAGAGFFTTDTTHPHAFFLNAQSICIDAGDPNYKDSDSSIMDIGAHPYIEWVGTEEIDSEKQSLNVFPNPFKTEFKIELTGQELIKSIRLFSIEGKMIRVIENIDKQSVSVDRNNLNRGVYLLKIEGSKNSYSNRIIAF